MAEVKEIVVGGGCFWCIEHDMKGTPGVVDITAGYAGGHVANPTYEMVGSHTTGHKEVIRVRYDAEKTNLEAVLRVFMQEHDYTDGEGQFCDRGEQYSPVIFVNGKDERAVAENVVSAFKGAKTAIEDYDAVGNGRFWPAEDYHQDYAEKNATQYKFYRWGCGRDARLEELKK